MQAVFLFIFASRLIAAQFLELAIQSVSTASLGEKASPTGYFYLIDVTRTILKEIKDSLKLVDVLSATMSQNFLHMFTFITITIELNPRVRKTVLPMHLLCSTDLARP
jgi:hypothetical protein